MIGLGRTRESNIEYTRVVGGHSCVGNNHGRFYGRSMASLYGGKSLYGREEMSENFPTEVDLERTDCNDYHVKQESLGDCEFIGVNRHAAKDYYPYRQEDSWDSANMSRVTCSQEEQRIKNYQHVENRRLLSVREIHHRRDRSFPIDNTSDEKERSSGPGKSSVPRLFRPFETSRPTLNVKILKPDEINEHAAEKRTNSEPIEPQIELRTHQRIHNQIREEDKYQILKQQLSSQPNARRRPPVLTKLPRGTNTTETEQRANTISEESILFISHFNIDARNHPYAITRELVDDLGDEFTPEDSTLRFHVIVFLWVLLGERRLMRAGYPSDDIHLVLWRIVHVCCSVAGVKSAAAVPLPENHNCRDDMLCFRDHVHRFLEVCAPTRDLWKQFGWASLTVEAVMRKIYREELLYTLLKHLVAIPTPIKMAMQKLATLERNESERQFAAAHSLRNTLRWQKIPKLPNQMANKSNMGLSYFRPILPKPPEKKKRGRPVKIKKNLPETAGRIQRVMLWRFIMNLLEEPGNAACIHWVKREEGIFRILNTDWLARIWGRRHGNPRMTYEKMARAMRTYYRSKVLQPVPRTRNLPRKLVYKFNPALIKKLPTNT